MQKFKERKSYIIGLWAERLGGGWATQGAYTTSAIDTLVGCLERERLQVAWSLESDPVGDARQDTLMHDADGDARAMTPSPRIQAC